MFSRKAKETGLFHQHLKRFRLRERDVIMLLKHFSITRNKQDAVVSARIQDGFLIELRAYDLKHGHQFVLTELSEQNSVAGVGVRKRMVWIASDSDDGHAILRQNPRGLNTG